MDHNRYRKTFSRAVRWRLPNAEAEDVLADYEGIFSQYPGEIPVQELGQPLQAARLLSEPHAYHRWLAAFGLMAACLLLPWLLLLRAAFRHDPSLPMYLLFLLGAGTALIWFRPRHGARRSSPLPKGLRPVLLGLLAVVAAAAAILAGLIRQAWPLLSPDWYGRVAHGALLLAGTAGAAFGLLGLIQARIADRRWCSLYVLGLTALVGCVLMLSLLTTLSAPGPGFDWLRPTLYHLAIVGAAGGIGVGVSLC